MDPDPADPSRRRRMAVLAGYRGDTDIARRLGRDLDPSVRAAAIGALARHGVLEGADVRSAMVDADPSVRQRACELAVPFPEIDLTDLLGDPDPAVVEAAAWALGERGDGSESPGGSVERAVAALAEVATDHADPMCREAAVAALGAVGHPAGLAAILAATTDRPAIRRRAVIALTPFEGPEVDAAMALARHDRDWQVRQAARELADGPAGPAVD